MFKFIPAIFLAMTVSAQAAGVGPFCFKDPSDWEKWGQPCIVSPLLDTCDNAIKNSKTAICKARFTSQKASFFLDGKPTEYENAIPTADDAIKLHPHPFAYYVKARAYGLMKDFKRSVEVANYMFEKFPESERYRRALNRFRRNKSD